MATAARRADKYRVTLTDRAGNRYGEMPPVGSSGLTFGDVINGGASATITPDLELPIYSGGNRRNLSAWASEVLIERLSGPGETGIVYNGPVTQPHADYDQRTLSITCGSLFDWFLTERLITDDITFTGQEQTSVAVQLMRRYSTGMTGLGDAGDVRLDYETLSTGRKVTQPYLRTDQKSVGQAVKDLATARNGFDFTIDYAYGPQNSVRRTWRPHAPEMGRLIETPLFEGKGGLRSFSIEEATDIVTVAYGMGQAQTVATTTTSSTAATTGVDDAQDAIFAQAQAAQAVQDRYGVHVKPLQGSDATTRQVLQSLVNEYLSTRRPPVDVVSFSYKVSKSRPYGFIGLGDTVPIVARRGWASYDGLVRVVARSTAVDSNGGEVVTCTAQGVESDSTV